MAGHSQCDFQAFGAGPHRFRENDATPPRSDLDHTIHGIEGAGAPTVAYLHLLRGAR